MHLPLSNRLLACIEYVNPGDRVADIGCDHGYLSIYLLKEGIAKSVIASDVNKLPLQSAMANAIKYGVKDKINFYQSDGVRSIPREFDVLICAGMGADTMISILEAAPWLKDRQYRLILQCQSRRSALREYLYANGYCIVRETLAQDGKFIYPVMEVHYAPGPALTPGGYYISPALLESHSSLLPAFYERVVSGLRTTVEGLFHSGSTQRLQKYQAILSELSEMEEQIYGNRS